MNKLLRVLLLGVTLLIPSISLVAALQSDEYVTVTALDNYKGEKCIVKLQVPPDLTIRKLAEIIGKIEWKSVEASKRRPFFGRPDLFYERISQAIDENIVVRSLAQGKRVILRTSGWPRTDSNGEFEKIDPETCDKGITYNIIDPLNDYITVTALNMHNHDDCIAKLRVRPNLEMRTLAELIGKIQWNAKAPKHRQKAFFVPELFVGKTKKSPNPYEVVDEIAQGEQEVTFTVKTIMLRLDGSGKVDPETCDTGIDYKIIEPLAKSVKAEIPPSNPTPGTPADAGGDASQISSSPLPTQVIDVPVPIPPSTLLTSDQPEGTGGNAANAVSQMSELPTVPGPFQKPQLPPSPQTKEVMSIQVTPHPVKSHVMPEGTDTHTQDLPGSSKLHESNNDQQKSKKTLSVQNTSGEGVTSSQGVSQKAQQAWLYVGGAAAVMTLMAGYKLYHYLQRSRTENHHEKQTDLQE